MIEVLQLTELEEIIQHKQQPSVMPLSLLVPMWQERIGQSQRDADVWQEILSVRYLAVPPSSDPKTWLKFCSLCRKSGRSAQSQKLLSLVQQVTATPPGGAAKGRDGGGRDGGRRDGGTKKKKLR